MRVSVVWPPDSGVASECMHSELYESLLFVVGKNVEQIGEGGGLDLHIAMLYMLAR